MPQSIQESLQIHQEWTRNLIFLLTWRLGDTISLKTCQIVIHPWQRSKRKLHHPHSISFPVQTEQTISFPGQSRPPWWISHDIGASPCLLWWAWNSLFCGTSTWTLNSPRRTNIGLHCNIWDDLQQLLQVQQQGNAFLPYSCGFLGSICFITVRAECSTRWASGLVQQGSSDIRIMSFSSETRGKVPKRKPCNISQWRFIKWTANTLVTLQAIKIINGPGELTEIAFWLH